METLLKNRMAIWAKAVLTLALLTTAACTTKTSAAIPQPPPDVEVAAVEQRDVPIYREWIGTLDGMVNAAIKAQVTGYLLTQNYVEGSHVRKGQLLFQIDPRSYQAAVELTQGQLAQANGQLAQSRAQLLQAKAQLASAEANQRKAQLDEDRYVPLAQQQAISQQDLDNATQSNLAAKAQVEAARAQVETANAQIQASSAAVEAAKAAVDNAKVNLEFTRLTSPIDGISGVAQTQLGNLVSPASNPVTTVSTVDRRRSQEWARPEDLPSYWRIAPDGTSLFWQATWTSSWRPLANAPKLARSRLPFCPACHNSSWRSTGTKC